MVPHKAWRFSPSSGLTICSLSGRYGRLGHTPRDMMLSPDTMPWNGASWCLLSRASSKKRRSLRQFCRRSESRRSASFKSSELGRFSGLSELEAEGTNCHRHTGEDRIYSISITNNLLERTEFSYLMMLTDSHIEGFGANLKRIWVPNISVCFLREIFVHIIINT